MLRSLSRLGEVIGGRYELLEVIGEGGMGTVYKARHSVSEHLVALKLLNDSSSSAARALGRFKREASASARIGHPGLVQVLDAGSATQGELFIAMELLQGETLKVRFAADAISMGEKLEWLLKLLEPLEALHAAGFVHRDLKPDNVFIARGADGAEQIKLLDFGLAREIGADTATVTGAAFGTPHYMAPEQSVSAKDVTSAADVWAAGVMLYEALAGTKPFNGETPNAIIVAACTSAYPSLAQTTLSHELVRLVDACLAKQPEDRLQTAGALRSALAHALRADAGPKLPSHDITTGKQSRDGERTQTSPSVADTLLNADTLELPHADHRPSPPEEQAEQETAPAPLGSRSRRWTIGVFAGFLGGGALLWLAASRGHDGAVQPSTHAALSAVPVPSSLVALAAQPSAPADRAIPTASVTTSPNQRSAQPRLGLPWPSATPQPSASQRSATPKASAAPDDDPGYLDVWKGQ